MAAIIYWQAKEISRIIKENSPEEAGIDIMLLAHISPIAWSNVSNSRFDSQRIFLILLIEYLVLH
jgi:hypothetical protein